MIIKLILIFAFTINSIESQTTQTSQCKDLTTLRKEALDATNSYRANHSAAALVESSALNDVAQKYAETLLSNGKLSHSSSGYGENLYYSMGMAISGKLPIDSWYSEVKNYDFDKGTSTNGGVVGHFTQVVWLGSKQVGHGFAMSSDCKTLYVVANYDPPGNYVGQYVANVKKGSSTTPTPTPAVTPTPTTSTTSSKFIYLSYGIFLLLLLF